MAADGGVVCDPLPDTWCTAPCNRFSLLLLPWFWQLLLSQALAASVRQCLAANGGIVGGPLPLTCRSVL